MTSTTFNRGPDIGCNRIDVDQAAAQAGQSDRPRLAKSDDESRGPLLILGVCLFTLAWIVLFRDVRVGLPGSMPEVRRGTGAVAGRPLETPGQGGALPPPGIPGHAARGVAGPPR